MPLCIRKTSPKPYCAAMPRVLPIGLARRPYSAAAIALPTSAVPAVPPRSGVRGAPLPGASTFSMEASTASWACLWPKNSSIIAPHQICPMGLAMLRPAMSGAEPCTGSNSEGNLR